MFLGTYGRSNAGNMPSGGQQGIGNMWAGNVGAAPQGMPTQPQAPVMRSPQMPPQQGAPMNAVHGANGYMQPTQPMQPMGRQPLAPQGASAGMMNNMLGANSFSRFMSPQYNPYVQQGALKAFMGGMYPQQQQMPSMNSLISAIPGYGAALQYGAGAIQNLYGGGGNIMAAYPPSNDLVQFRPLTAMV